MNVNPVFQIVLVIVYLLYLLISHQLLFGERLTDYFADVIFLALGLEPPSYSRTIPPLNIAIFLQNPSANGWETEGPCAVYFGSSPQDSLNQGLQPKSS